MTSIGTAPAAPLRRLFPCTGLTTSICTDPGDSSNILSEKSGYASLILHREIATNRFRGFDVSHILAANVGE
jgi:hypothetical protein